MTLPLEKYYYYHYLLLIVNSTVWTQMTKPSMRITYGILAAALGLALSSSFITSALAAAHIQGPAPTCSVSGSTLSCSSFQIAGLGNTPATAQLTITGTFSTQCTNPGGNVAPGQSKTASGTSGPVSISTDKNGKATVPPLSATAQPPSQTELNALCPNPQWTGSVSGFTVTSATITVTQNGAVVFSLQVV